MKKHPGSPLFLLALLSVVASSTPASATVTWRSGFEKGDLSEWTSSNTATTTLADGTVRKNIEFSGERVYAGNYACKLTIHPDDIFPHYAQNRVDMRRDSMLTGEGKDSYVSGYYFLPENAKTRNEIFFYETKSSMNWMDLWIEPKTDGGTTVKFGIESNGANLGSVLLWTGDWKPGVWHQFAIHVHWSTDATKGIVDVWFDGQQVITAHKHNTKFNTTDSYFQIGMHRVLTKPFTETIYFDDFIEADTLAEIKVGTAIPGGLATPDAGTDATGAAGTGAATDGGAGGAGGSGTAGSGPTGAAGNGTAGATGTAGAGPSGTAGTTGGAGSGATGAAGTSSAGGTGGVNRAEPDIGCACGISSERHRPVGLATGLSLLIAMALARRRRREPGRRHSVS